MSEVGMDNSQIAPKVQPEGREKGITLAQLSAANVDFYLRLQNIFDTVAQDYTLQKYPELEGQAKSRKYRQTFLQTRVALENLYFIPVDNKEEIERFKGIWGSEAHGYLNLLNQINSEIEVVKQKTIENAHSLGTKDRVKIALRAGPQMLSLTERQRAQILEMSGYSASEIKDLIQKLAISGSISFTAGSAYETISAAAALGSTQAPFAGELPNPSTFAWIVGSYAAYYSSMLANAIENKRLLKDKSIQNSPNFVATSTYYLMKRFFPDNEKVQDAGAILGSFVLETGKEIGWAATMFIPVVGPSMLSAGSLMGAGFNFAQVAVAEGYRKYVHNKARKNSEANQNI